MEVAFTFLKGEIGEAKNDDEKLALSIYHPHRRKIFMYTLRPPCGIAKYFEERCRTNRSTSQEANAEVAHRGSCGSFHIS